MFCSQKNINYRVCQVKWASQYFAHNFFNFHSLHFNFSSENPPFNPFNPVIFLRSVRTRKKKFNSSILRSVVMISCIWTLYVLKSIYTVKYRMPICIFKGYTRNAHRNSVINLYFFENKILVFKFPFNSGNQIKFPLLRKSSIF